MAENSATHELDARLLVVANESGQTREFPMGLPTDSGSRVIVGRSRDADLTIHDDYISNSHLAITFSDSQHWLEDLGSTHGTELDGERLSRKVALKTGAMITLGRSTCQYRCVEREISKVSLSTLNSSDPPASHSGSQPSATIPAPASETADAVSSNADHSVSFGDMTDVGAESFTPDAKQKRPSGVRLVDYALGILGIVVVVSLIAYLGWMLFFVNEHSR